MSTLRDDVADTLIAVMARRALSMSNWSEGFCPEAADAVLALLKERGATAWIDGPIFLSSDDSERIGVGTALVVLLEEAPYDEDDVLEGEPC